MKRFYCLLLGSLLLSQSAFCSSVSSEANSTQNLNAVEKPAPLSDGEVRAYMDAIVVQQFDIHRAQLPDALNHLDGILEPYGIQILFEDQSDEERIVSLKTRNLSMGKNLSYLCRQIGYDWWVDNGVIVVGLPGSNEAMVTEFIPVRSTTARRLAYIQSARE